ncbi:uncharacterized protein [Dermacentor albipictus]|uniref:uncharacterized protein n=1 Tax=Dermacentor albipictus TaxID=60249 RepID=UPI0038FCC541
MEDNADKRRKSSLPKNRPPSNAGAKATGAPTAAAADAHASSASSQKPGFRGSNRESDASSAPDVSTGQPRVTPVVDGTDGRQHAPEDVTFKPNTDTKVTSAAPSTHVDRPPSADPSKAPNTTTAPVDTSSRSDHRSVAATRTPSDTSWARNSGRSRKKRRRRNLKSSLSSASSTSSRTSKQGLGEGERKAGGAPSTSKPGQNANRAAPQDHAAGITLPGPQWSTGTGGVFTGNYDDPTPIKQRGTKAKNWADAQGRNTSAADPMTMASYEQSRASSAKEPAAPETAPERGVDAAGPPDGKAGNLAVVPETFTNEGKTSQRGVFTGNYDDSTPIKQRGTKAKNWADAQGRKTSAADPMTMASYKQSRASSAKEPAAPETAPASQRGVDAAGLPDGKAGNLAVVPETFTNEGKTSQQRHGDVFATMTATSYGSQDERPASHGAVPAGSAGVAAPEGHLVPEAPLGQKVVDGAAGPSAHKDGDSEAVFRAVLPTNPALPKAEALTSPRKVIEEQEPDQPPTAFTGQQGTSHPAPSGREQEDRTGWRKRWRNGNKAMEESGVSEVHVGSTRGALKSSFATQGHSWSFYPLNVSFVTEEEMRKECLVYGSVVCLSSVLFSMLVAFLLLAFFPNRALTPLVCATAECVAARDYLASLINTSRDTCGDFYGYVCDSWIARRKDAGSFLGDSMTASLASINESLWRKNAEGDSPDLRLARRVYQVCRRYMSGSSDTATLRETLESARKLLSWALIRDCRDYHALVALLVRTSLLVGFHTVLVTELFGENGRTVLRFTCGRSLVRKLATAGKRIDLQATLRTIVGHDFKDIHTILEVDELAGGNLDGPDCAASVEQADVVGPLSLFVGGIVPGVDANSWAQAVEEVLASSGENASQFSDSAVASGAAGFRRAFLSVVSAGGVEVSALYLATHLDVEIVSLELSRRHSDSEGAARICVALCRRPLAHSWSSLVAKMLNVRGSEEPLWTMFDQIKAMAHETTMFAWLPEVMRRVAAGKISGVNLEVASEDVSSNSARTGDATDPYASLLATSEERNATFVELFVRAMSVAHGLRIRSPPTRSQCAVSQLEERHEVAYLSATSSMVVPTLYRRAPLLYATSVPPHFNYATVGAVLATRIVDVVAPDLGTEVGQGTSQHADVWWARAAWRQFNASALCLQRLHERLGLRHRASGGEPQRRDMLLRAQGLRLAYDALVASLGPVVSDAHLRAHWHEAQVVFFVRFCLLSCDADQHRQAALSSRARCLVPLHNMPEFGAAFECASREDFVTEQCVA